MVDVRGDWNVVTGLGFGIQIVYGVGGDAVMVYLIVVNIAVNPVNA